MEVGLGTVKRRWEGEEGAATRGKGRGESLKSDTGKRKEEKRCARENLMKNFSSSLDHRSRKTEEEEEERV